MTVFCCERIQFFVSQRWWGWLERAKHLWHPSALLTWLCVWVQFNHYNPLPPILQWLILFDCNLLSTQIIEPHHRVIPSCKRRIKLFSAVRYFYPPTSLSVNYRKYSYIKTKPPVNWQSVGSTQRWWLNHHSGVTSTCVFPLNLLSSAELWQLE